MSAWGNKWQQQPARGSTATYRAQSAGVASRQSQGAAATGTAAAAGKSATPTKTTPSSGTSQQQQQQQGAGKRSSTPVTATVAASAPAGKDVSKGGVASASVGNASTAKSTVAALKVSTQTKTGDLVSTTLVGMYAEKGSNHGKQYYQKIERIPGHPDVNVFLYYWDARDGADFSGWWFGDKLGGTQVWSRAAVHTPTPPKIGWRVPWDAPTIQQGALIVEPVTAASTTAAPATAAAASQPAAASRAASQPPASQGPAGGLTPQQRLKKATDEVASAEKIVNNANALVKKTLENEKAPEAAIKSSLETLQKQVAKLSEIQNSIAKDISECRKAGPSAANSVTELSKLAPKIKTLQSSVNAEMNKVKARQIKLQSEKQKAEAEKKKKEADEEAKKKDAKDASEFAAMLPKIRAAVGVAEAAVEAVNKAAAALVQKGEGSESELNAIEKSAADATKKVTDARTDLTAKIAVVGKFAPEARKKAMPELTELQTKLANSLKSVVAHKDFKKGFAARLTARKALKEFADKFDSLEADINRADGLAKASGMSDDDVLAVDKLITPTGQSLNTLLNQIGQRVKAADAAQAAELEQLKLRGASVRSHLEALSKKVKGQRDELLAHEALVTARGKVDKIEECMSKCQDAEMPFLKGIEVLPKAESDKALSDSDTTASEAHSIINQAKVFVKSKIAESKRYQPELARSVEDQLKSLMARVETAESKLESFRKDTAERRTNALLAEVVDSIAEVERAVSAVKDAAKILATNVEASTADAIREAIEKTRAAEKEATAVCANAKKVIASKQKVVKSSDGSAGMNKLQNRFGVAQADLAKQRQLADSAEKVIKLKLVLEQQSEKLAGAEAEVEKAERAVPTGDEDFSEEAVKSMDDAMASGMKMLKALPAALQPHLASAPADTKAQLQKLLDGSKACLEKLDKLKQSTKDRREKALGALFVKECEVKVLAVESASEKMSDVELPFLMGVEVLPISDAKNTVLASEAALKATQDAIAHAKAHIAQKTIEVRAFSASASAAVNEAFKDLNARIAADTAKAAAFAKDTARRKKIQQMQEAAEMVGQSEELTKKTLEAAEPFLKEGAETLSDEEVAEPLRNFIAIEREAKKTITETKTFVAERQRVSKDNAEHIELLKKLQARLVDVDSEMTKLRKRTATHEQRFTAKRIVVEANEKIKSLDTEVQTATAACAKLLEEGGQEFLAFASIRVLGAALAAYMKVKVLDLPALFKEASAGKRFDSVAFVKYLEGLPVAINHEEVEFTDERRNAIFTLLDNDKDGVLSEAEFAGIFKVQGVCKKGVTLTDGFSIGSSKTIGKVEPGVEFETVGAPREDEGGLWRSEVKLLSGEFDTKQGWITMKTTQGTLFVDLHSAYEKYCKDMKKAINLALTNINLVSTFLSDKGAEGGSAAAGTALADARTELNKLKKDVQAAVASIDALKKKVAAGEREFAEKEKAERNAHLVAKAKKEAEGIVGVAKSLAEAAVVSSKATEEKAQPLTSLPSSELGTFGTPLSTLVEVEALAAAAARNIETARKSIKEQILLAAKITPPTTGSAEAKRQLTAMQVEVERASKASSKALDSVKSRCEAIVDKIVGEVEQAFRLERQRRGMTCEAFFEQLAGGKAELQQSAFCKLVASVGSVSASEEHVKLLARRIAGSGNATIARRAFMGFVQKYATVVKDIALTTSFDLNTTATIRKAEKEELFEILEGPQKDEKFGVERVLVRSILDGKEGWVSVKGNQGTSFLRDSPKPMYSIRLEVTLEKDFSSAEAIRTLAADEILEVLEGPRKQVFPDILRARVKMSKDNAVGWVTLRDRMEVVYADCNPKLYTCVASVAMTDGGNIQDCKVLRKLALGELFEAGGEVQEESGVFRVQGKALKDGMNGWITTKGNAGTVYAQVADKIYCVKKQVELCKSLPATGKAEVVRKLDVGETFDLLSPPREDRQPAEIRVKVRAQSDGATGWISKKDTVVKPWSATYKVLEKVPLHDSRSVDVEGCKEVRELSKGEAVELLDGPVKDGRVLRIKCRAKGDGAIGWTTLREDGDSKEGKVKRFLEC